MEIQMKNSTYAMKAKQVLSRFGIRSYVGKKTGDRGCYYIINLLDSDAEKGLRLLKENHLIDINEDGI